MNDYFVWDFDPEMFTLGPLDLPFEISIPAIVLAVLGTLGASWLKEKDSEISPDDSRSERRRKRRNRKKENSDDSGLTALAQKLPGYVIFLVLFGLGQLLFISTGFPTIETIGPIAPRYYGLMFALAFFVGYQLGQYMFTNGGFTQEQLDSLLIHMILAVVIGARLGHVLFYDPAYYLSNPLEILKIWEGGLASHGAAFGILAGLYLFQQKHQQWSFLWITDRVMITVASGAAFIRLGNFFNSEIIGHVTDVPWAIIFAARGPLPHHPSMLYESLVYFTVFILLIVIYRRYKNAPPEGLLFSAFLIFMFIGRFMVEFTKQRQADFASDWAFSMGQWLSIPFILLGIWLYWKYVRDERGEVES